MKVTPSPLVARLSGKAAAAVAASWKGILYVREHVIPHNPQSAAQIIQRAHMGRMSPWHRSLPDAITTWLDDLAVGLGKSGFNTMVGLDLSHLADSEVPEIVPGNPKCNALFSITGAPGGAAGVLFSWDAGNALPANHVHPFTCPVDPAEGGKEEPDGWTYHGAKTVPVSDGTTVDIIVLNASKDYYVVGIVADQNILADATVISGGIGDTATSHA